MRTLSIAMAGLLAGCLLGCEAAPVPQAADATEAAPSPPPPAPPAEPAVAEAPKPKASAKGDAVIEAARKAGEAKRAKAAADAAAGGEPPADAPPADAPPMEDGAAPPDGELSKAEVGVGAKGQGYGGAGFVTTPIEAMFRAEERIRFEAQIPENLKIYKASHDNKGPATHEEFMKVIIDEGGIPLPELPQGSEYWYDVETEQLMVRTPQAPE